MSLTKKDPSLRVAPNNPHLVSLGGGRLSTAVTIHYIPIGDMSIGSSTNCSISLNGSGVLPLHCTIYRSEENEVTLVPEPDARVLIDGAKVTQDINLTQGAMITIGNSNYLRFNNPAEARMMLSAMGSNERISMPQIDFTQSAQHGASKSNGSMNDSAELHQALCIDNFYDELIAPAAHAQMTMSVGRDALKPNSSKSMCNNLTPIDINELQCPKVFTADLVTVNMPAKDVLGQKYANFAKNLAENCRSDKHVNALRNNNQLSNNLKASASSRNAPGNYVNIPSTSNFIQNHNATANSSTTTASNNSSGSEYLTKVNNTTPLRGAAIHHNISPYDRYPKPGTYGGLQIFPMNGVNTEINNGSASGSPLHVGSGREMNSPSFQRRNLSNLSTSETERLEDMLKICTEYADRQNQSSSSVTSSPIVQNRIKTNGSLPRDKKSPFYHELAGASLQQSFSGSNSNLQAKPHNTPVCHSTGYENVRLLGPNRVEVGGQLVDSSSPKTGYENVIGKYVPQSPRTKIRTTCMSPKKEQSFSQAFGQSPPAGQTKPPLLPKPTISKNIEYEQLIKAFEEKTKLEMLAIQEGTQYKSSATANRGVASAEQSPARRVNKNINNLTLNLHEPSSLQNSPKFNKKPAPAPRIRNKTASADAVPSYTQFTSGCHNVQTSKLSVKNADSNEDLDQLKKSYKELWQRVTQLKNDISELQKQENEVLREMDMEEALVTAEVNSVGYSVGELETQLEALRNKIHRLEAQRNATRVMEENQQAKLKQSIEMKQDQVRKLRSMLQQKPNNDCLKEELHSVSDSLENDRKTFEDLEFQYLEEESEWHAYREELHNDETGLVQRVEEKRKELQYLQKQELTNQSFDAKTLKLKLISTYSELNATQERLKMVEQRICDITGQLQVSSSDDDDSMDDKLSASTGSPPLLNNLGSGVMSQSLFGSAELLCPKRSSENIMSKSVNENMFYNNKIELPTAQATSTPKRPQLKAVTIDDVELLRVKEQRSTGEDLAENERVKFNLSLGSDDFEVNPLEKRVPSQDDIDRISKVTTDAPISTKGASTKIFDSIKEIERNRQLLLAQQGHHVIEHERQKINDLKRKCHDEARAQYLSMLSTSVDKSNNATSLQSNHQAQKHELQRLERLETEERTNLTSNSNENTTQKQCDASKGADKAAEDTNSTSTDNANQLRHSQPEFDTQHLQHQQLQRLRHSRSGSRPLSEANSELSYDLLAEHNNSKSNVELSHRYSAEQAVRDEDASAKRSSVNSSESASGGSGHSERKRALPKHQRPLTRYLPIFSPDLNLRHHIESAGHQIALCPHVFVDAYSCRGYLHKLGATFHGWARRWFVLDRQRNALIYFSDKSERKPRGGAYFSTIDEVYLDHLNASKSGRPHCTFIVKTKKRSYHLQAASDAAARIWIDAIITGAQGNLDY